MVSVCLDRLVLSSNKLNQKDNGNILMHDSTTDNPMSIKFNKACETFIMLYPLNVLGFLFIGLDEIPGIN